MAAKSSIARRRKARRRAAYIYRRRALLALTVAVLCFVVALAAAKLSKSGSRDNAGNVDTVTDSASLNSTVSDGQNALNVAGGDGDASGSDGSDLTANGYKIETIDGVTYVDGVLIANKTYSLPETFVPTNPEVPVTEDRSTTSLDKDLMQAWRSLQSAASAKGLNIYISSGYRSYSYQVKVYNTYVAKDGKALADTYSSRPGNSEHQTGLCFDLNSIDDSFADTKEGKWVNDNCYKYGFCIRFPDGKDAYTGYQYESWHLRYVGVELATKLYNNGDWLSLEEYFGITSEYPN